MNTATIVTQGPSPEEDYGLDAIAKHNALASTEEFPAFNEDAKGLGIYDGYEAAYQDGQSYVHNPPTPRSNTASEGVRTRSGRSTRGLTDSPFSTSKSRVSKSPAPRARKEKKSKLDRSKTPKLTAPLSVLTKDSTIPCRDIDALVNRSTEVRQEEIKHKKNGLIPRPMNSFMLYRSCYAERTKQWCSQNNHQIVSAVAGESWPMESDEVRQQFDDWAKLERQHHQEAHPNYKFSPSKASAKKRKGEFSDDEGLSVDLDNDPDGEYGGGRRVRQRRQDRREAAYLPGNVGFDSHPYYGHQLNGYEQSQYQYANPGRALPSNVAYDGNGVPYNPHTGAYLQHGMPQQQQQHQYQYVQEMQGARVPTPASLNGQQSLGGFGLPGGQADDIFSSSRTSTPMQHYQQSYGQPMYPQYQQHYQAGSYQAVPTAPTPPQPGSQMYEHQQYLQQASQPQSAIDPSLEAAMQEAAAAGSQGAALENHFDDAIGDMNGGGSEYYEEHPTSPVDVNAYLKM